MPCSARHDLQIVWTVRTHQYDTHAILDSTWMILCQERRFAKLVLRTEENAMVRIWIIVHAAQILKIKFLERQIALVQ